jgi:hypothetical protein
VSLEKSGIWIIASSPMSLKRILTIKYMFNLVTAVLVIEFLLIFANIFINVDRSIYIVMPTIGLFVAAALVSINLGLGSRFPHFNEDNPSRIAAGSGGIIAALASVAYVGISILILATPAYNYISNAFLNRPINHYLVYGGFALFVLFSAATSILPMRIGIKSLQRRDF